MKLLETRHETLRNLTFLRLNTIITESLDKQNFIRATDNLAELQSHISAADKPNLKQLTMALKAAHFQYGAYEGVRGWYAKRM